MQPPARCSNHRCVYIDQCVEADFSTELYSERGCIVIRKETSRIEATDFNIDFAVEAHNAVRLRVCVCGGGGGVAAYIDFMSLYGIH